MTSSLCVLAHRQDPDRPRPALPGEWCCAGCHDDLARRLDSIPDLVDDLERALIPGGRGQTQRVSGDPETALPYNDRASDARTTLLARLGSWTLMIAEERDEHLPRNTNPGGLAAWHRTRLDWTCRQGWLPDYAAELREDTGRARGVLAGQRSKRVPLGACPDDDRCDVQSRTGLRCDGTLTATVDLEDDLLPASVACTVCGRAYPARELVALGKRLSGGRRWLTTVEAAQVLGLSQRQVRDVAEGSAWRRRDPDGVRPCRWDADDVDAYRTRREIAS